VAGERRGISYTLLNSGGESRYCAFSRGVVGLHAGGDFRRRSAIPVLLAVNIAVFLVGVHGWQRRSRTWNPTHTLARSIRRGRLSGNEMATGSIQRSSRRQGPQARNPFTHNDSGKMCQASPETVTRVGQSS